jgi:hypothetical protein
VSEELQGGQDSSQSTDQFSGGQLDNGGNLQSNIENKLRRHYHNQHHLSSDQLLASLVLNILP